MKNVLILLVVFTSFLAESQLPAGTIAPNFTATDINGNTHTLYDYLDQGYKVIMDISATWCPPCWSYHNAGVMEAIYEEHGPDGDQTVMAFFVEGDPQTTLADLYGTGSNTLGNWVAGTNYPILDVGSLSSLYCIPGFPTTYLICPNRTIIRSDAGNPPSLNTANSYFAHAQCQNEFSCDLPTTTQVVVEMTTDNFPGEVTWKIKNESNQVVASGGPYAQSTSATSPVNVHETHYLPGSGCYSFHLYDAYGDGLHASQWQSQYSDGYCKVYGVNTSGNAMAPFYYYNGSYDLKEGVAFSNVSTSVGISEYEPENGFEVYPNPSQGDMNVNYSLKKSSKVSVSIMNLLGEKVWIENFGNQSHGIHNRQLDLSSLESGIYLMSFTIDNETTTSKITISR